MISLIPAKNLTASDMKFLRTLSSFSIADIRKAAENGASVRDFDIFRGNWETERTELAKICVHYLSAKIRPYSVKESDEYGLDEHLTPEQFRARLKYWRSIELETQKHTDLENGDISDPKEFVPHDGDWTNG